MTNETIAVIRRVMNDRTDQLAKRIEARKPSRNWNKKSIDLMNGADLDEIEEILNALKDLDSQPST